MNTITASVLWEEACQCEEDDVEVACHNLFDLSHACANSVNVQANTQDVSVKAPPEA